MKFSLCYKAQKPNYSVEFNLMGLWTRCYKTLLGAQEITNGIQPLATRQCTQRVELSRVETLQQDMGGTKGHL